MVMLLTVEWPLVVQKTPLTCSCWCWDFFLVWLIVVLFDYFCIDYCLIQMCCTDNLLCKDPHFLQLMINKLTRIYCSLRFGYFVNCVMTSCCSHPPLTTVVDVTVFPSFVPIRRVTPRSGGVLCCPAEVVRQSTVREVLSVVGVSVGVLGVPALTGKQAVRHRLGPHVTPCSSIVKTVVVYKIQSYLLFTSHFKNLLWLIDLNLVELKVFYSIGLYIILRIWENVIQL